MRPALDVSWESARDWYNGMVGLATMNFLWLILSLTVVLLPPATAGIYVATHGIARGTGGRIEDFWFGLRHYGWVSYRWALANIVSGVVFAVSFSFYGATGSAFGVVIQVIFATAALLWITTQFYVWPFLIEQEGKQLRLALKNALFLTLANPLYTSILLGIVFGVWLFSILLMLPTAVFAISFVALLGNRAVVERLTTYGKLPGSPSLSGEEI